MITQNQYSEFKILLKNDYVDDVLKELKKRNILSRHNKPYSESMIRKVFNGISDNTDIEKAIIKVYERRKKQHEALEEKKQQLLAS